jgi:hypothetical protein
MPSRSWSKIGLLPARSSTELRRTVRKNPGVAAVVLGCAIAVACKNGSGKPPIEAFASGEFRTPKGAIIKVPAAADRAWRVLMLQEEPRPKKNPHWRTIKIAESGTIEMPAGSHFKCIFNPVSFRSWPNDHLSGVDKWDLLRSVRCSSDGWATYSQAIHVVSISGDGASVVPNVVQTELNLYEVIDGTAVQLTIALRAD